MRRALAGVAAAAIAAGCATDPPAAAPGSAPAGTPQAPGPAHRSRIAPGQTGLEVRTWQVVDDGDRLERVLRGFELPAVGRVDDLALRRNGLILAQVPADRIEELVAGLGGSALDVRTWLGTATAWQELLSVPVGNTLVEVDGLARERPGGRLQLLARAWPLPMEDGTRIAVNLVPQFAQDRAAGSLLRGGGRLTGDAVRSCLVDLELGPGAAWVLTCDPGGFAETDADAPRRALEAETVYGPPEPGGGQASGKIGARVATVGAALLLAAPERAGAPSRRTVLVLVPHLGASPFPDAAPAEPIEHR